MSRMAAFELLLGDPHADRVVPRTGTTAWLTIFVSAVMGLLAAFALALALATKRVAENWSDRLGQSVTLRIPAAEGQRSEQVARALTVLETTPGVADVRVLSDAEQAALLAPWLGVDLPLGSLPMPQLVEVVPELPTFDAGALQLRLDGEEPGAVIDDHAAWRAPVVAAATRVRVVGWGALVLIGMATAALVVLSATATLAANAQVIEVLRLLGARDTYIARAFVRRLTFRTALGATVGVAVACFILLSFPGDQAAFLTGIRLQGGEWLIILGIPFAAAFVAFWSTRTAALARLRRSA
ncbi:MAG: FtsX-like permease family protein [Pseudomonadota bacterium]